ncbi:MAG: sugar ABC transporter permease [Candidatus Omnitrophica bacterium]|nr:sugar ABC transporter permease [Candidatus Omnitrophota bacterium]
MGMRRRQNLKDGLLFISPWIVGFTVFNLWPLLQSFYYSLCDYSVLNPPVYIGLGNYQELTEDPLLWVSLRNTLIYAILAVPFGFVVSLGVALLLNCQIYGRAFFRAVIFVPSLIPLVAMGVLWRGMFNGDYGIFNYLLGQLGVEGPNWLGDAAWMKPALVLTSLWGVGNTVVIYLAGLQEVPRHLYEVADIDGAGWFQKIIHVTLPSISPVIYFNVVVSVIFVLQIFVVPYVVFDPDGGTGRSALFYTMHLINTGFVSLRMGYACAMAWVLFVLIALLTYITQRVARSKIYYGGS